MSEERFGVQRAFARIDLADEAGRRVIYYVNIEDGGISIGTDALHAPTGFLSWPAAYAASMNGIVSK